MIRTLRITSVVAGLLAAGLLAFFSVSGVRGDQEVDRLLKSPTVIEQFAQDKGKPSAAGANPMSRLVEVARDFANVINPPAPPATVGTGPTGNLARGEPIRPPQVSAKFKLLATSYSAVDPNLSMALIDLPAGERRQFWVRMGQSVERETWKILQIKDGAMVYGEGQQTQEIAVEPRLAQVSLVDTGEPKPAPVSGMAGPSKAMDMPMPPPGGPGPSNPATARARLPRRPAGQNAVAGVRPPPAERNIQEIEKITERLRTLGKDVNDKALPPDQEKIRQETVKVLSSRLQAARMSQQEANSLGDLGRQLDHVQADANTNTESNDPQ
jgi:hypothetical protein